MRAAIGLFTDEETEGSRMFHRRSLLSEPLHPVVVFLGPTSPVDESWLREFRLLEKVIKTDCAGEDLGIEEIRMRICNAMSWPASRRKSQAEASGARREKTGFLSVSSGLFPVNNQQQ